MSELTPYPRSASEREEAEGPRAPSGGYASWGRRVAALLVDNILLLALAAIFFGLAFVPDDTLGGVALVLAFVTWLVLPFVYFTYFHGKSGQTLGKRWLRIRVEHAERGGSIGYGAALGRYGIVFVFSLFTLPLLLDYLFPLWDSKKQSLHDKVVSSIVVRSS